MAVVTAPDRFDALVLRLTSSPSRPKGVALMRIGLGASCALIYLVNVRERHFLWGPSAFLPLDEVATGYSYRVSSSLFTVSDSAVWFNGVYFGGLVVAILYTLNGGRVLGLLNLVLVMSLLNRNVLLLHGGHNVLKVCLPFLTLSLSDRHYSIGRRLWSARPGNAPPRERPLRSGSILLHNISVVLLVFQVAVIYFTAGYWKVIGGPWADGTAMYYISQLDAFRWWLSLPGFVWKNPIITTMMTYSIVILELALAPALALGRWVRFVAGGLIVMHIGIAVHLHLGDFALIMISALSLLLPEGGRRQQVGERTLPAPVSTLQPSPAMLASEA